MCSCLIQWIADLFRCKACKTCSFTMTKSDKIFLDNRQLPCWTEVHCFVEPFCMWVMTVPRLKCVNTCVVYTLIYTQHCKGNSKDNHGCARDGAHGQMHTHLRSIKIVFVLFRVISLSICLNVVLLLWYVLPSAARWFCRPLHPYPV